MATELVLVNVKENFSQQLGLIDLFDYLFEIYLYTFYYEHENCYVRLFINMLTTII